MARTFARIQDGVVRELIPEVEDIDQEWQADVVKTFVDVTNADPPVQLKWVRTSNGGFVPPTPVAPTRQQQMNIAVAAGCQLTSGGTPSLGATYDATGPRFDQMRGELQYIAGFGAFSGGLAELDWPARSGEVIFSTIDQFKAVVRAIADWLTAWQRYVDGKADAPPADPVIA